MAFNPTTPQPIMSDPGEAKEMPEPTPLNAPPPQAEQPIGVEGEGEGEGGNE